jgi:hypothetical protein
MVNQINERCDDLGQRMDAFARKQARAHLDSLPDPDDPGGELHPHGPAGSIEPRELAGDSMRR